MSDKLYAVINGERVRLDDCEGRVTKREQQEKLKKILHTKQKADVINRGIDVLYIEVMENERRANGTKQDPSSVNITVGGPMAA